jgi:hypothetical protein
MFEKFVEQKWRDDLNVKANEPIGDHPPARKAREAKISSIVATGRTSGPSMAAAVARGVCERGKMPVGYYCIDYNK